MLQNNGWSYNEVFITHKETEENIKYDRLKINRFKLRRKLITVYNKVIQKLETLSPLRPLHSSQSVNFIFLSFQSYYIFLFLF